MLDDSLPGRVRAQQILDLELGLAEKVAAALLLELVT
jgi:hypothetical protein